jgi:hypothetical protein
MIVERKRGRSSDHCAEIAPARRRQKKGLIPPPDVAASGWSQAHPRPAILDCDVAVFAPAALTEPLQESGNPLALALWRALAREPDDQRLRLLRLRGERPSRRPAEHRKELATLHSITSSARARSIGENVPYPQCSWRPSDLVGQIKFSQSIVTRQLCF